MNRAPAQTNYQQFLSFGPSTQQGSAPRGQLLKASDGFLYGTTYQGGSRNFGTVYRVATNGTGHSVLWSFTNAMFPTAGVIEGPGGALYGTTSAGGAHNSGVVFKLQKNSGGFTVLHDFGSSRGDGNTPLANVLAGSDGALYGTTAGGGISNAGCVFRLAADGTTYTNLHEFTGLDGSTPAAGLIQAVNGRLYGVAKTGGSNNLGTVFSLPLEGGGFSVLHHFAGKGQNDGSQPLGNLVETGSGDLYGTTYTGGSAADLGTIFKLSTNGNEYAVLHPFLGGADDGSLPVSGLARSQGGNVLYGTTPHGGATDEGKAFSANADDNGYAILHTFNSGLGDGSIPFAPLLVSSDGVLYGSTYFGGAYATNGVSGTLFHLVSAPPRIVITSITPGPQGMTLKFAGGAAGQPYHIEASADLDSHAWAAIGTNWANIDGTFSFLDSGAPNYRTRFYRGALP